MRSPMSLLAVVLLVAVLMVQANLTGSALSFGQLEKSWSQTVAVPAGESRSVTGGFSEESVFAIQVLGNVLVESCCGYSTNDIVFFIEQSYNSLGRYYGPISGSFSFEWSTESDYRHFLVFDNTFDQSTSSFHNKTVEVNIREGGQTRVGYALGTILPLVMGVAVFVVAAGVVLSLVLIQRERKRKLPGQATLRCRWSGNPR